ncbi:MAG: ATP-binding cassette domain-containing protein [Acidimicrobiia bacterium]|nr:ATP-binding cassette domain-containing protein [Acidimicrobiia bacterium]
MIPLIEYHNVTVVRKQRAVLDGLSFQIGLGEHVAILGPNGSGKSSLVKTITRELYPDPNKPDSWLKIMGKERWNIFDLRPLLGVVSYDWVEICRREYSSYETVLSGFFGSVGVWKNHHLTQEMERKAREVMERLELWHLAARPTEELSTGESRRVLIARALVHDPKALIFDEPTNSLDMHACRELREILRRIAAQGTGIVLVTHHLPDIVPEIERVILLKDGKVFAHGSTPEMLTEARLRGVFGEGIEVMRKDGYYHGW